MNTSSIRSFISKKFGCQNPEIEQHGKGIFVIIMPQYRIEQSKAQILEISLRFKPIKVRGKNVIVRGTHAEIIQCLEELQNIRTNEESISPKPRFFNKASGFVR